MSERFGKYELLRRIGVGGMAEVYRARTYGAEGFVKDVVIKRILPAFSEDPDFVAMFINEARLAALLQHANIVQIFDFDSLDGVHYIAMEWVDGADLRRVQTASRRRDLPLPHELVIHVGVETLKGLHYAHKKKQNGRELRLVHRDVSPHNLLMSLHGEVKIADFGIAKIAALASATRTGMVKGKLTYMSPEQVRGEQIDGRTDLYALGIVLWELLAHRRLYADLGSEGELVAAARRGAVSPLSEIAPDVPRELCDVVARMLAPAPDERFADAAAALSALSPLAGAASSLEAAAFLRKLLPELAERDNKGGTEMLDPGGRAAPASPEVPTHTLEAGARDDEGEQQSPSARTTTAGPSASDEEPTVDGATGTSSTPLVGELANTGAPGRQRPAARFQLVRVLGAAVVFICGAAVAFGVAHTFRRKKERAAPPAARLVVATTPPGAALRVDGVLLAQRSPTSINGVRGTELLIDARAAGASARQRVVIGSRRRLHLVLKPASKGRGATAEAGIPVDAAARQAHLTSRDDPDAGGPAGRSRDSGGRRSRRAAGGRRRQVRARASGGGSGHPRTRRRGRAQAHVDVIVVPWARVTIDGRSVGITPRRGLKVRAGRHVIELRNPALGKRERLKVRLRRGQKLRIERRWLR